MPVTCWGVPANCCGVPTPLAALRPVLASCLTVVPMKLRTLLASSPYTVSSSASYVGVGDSNPGNLIADKGVPGVPAYI